MTGDAKTIALLSAGIALASAMHFWTRDAAPAGRHDGFWAEPLVRFQPGRPMSIEVRRGADRTALSSDGRSWRVESPFNSAADAETAMRLVDALAFTRPSAVYSDAELAEFGRSKADYGLDRSALEIVATQSGGGERVVRFGSSLPGADGVFASVAGEDCVYILPSTVKAAADLAPVDFRDRNLCQAEPGEIDSFDMKLGKGAFMRLRREGGMWKRIDAGTQSAQGSPAASVAAESVLAAVCGLKADSFVWPAGASGEPASATPSLLAGYGLDADSAVSVVLRKRSGPEIRLVFGKEAAPGRVFCLAQHDSAIAVAPMSAKTALESAAFSDERLFPVPYSSIVRFAVSGGGCDCSAVKDADGGWRLVSPVEAPADREIAELVAANIAALKTQDAAGNGVRVSPGAGIEPVEVAREAVFGSLRPEDLRSKEVLSVSAGDVRRLVARMDKTARRVVVEALPETSLLSPLMAARVARLKADAEEMKRFGLDDPIFALDIDFKGEGVARKYVLFGSRDGQGCRYATVGASGTVFAVPERTVEALEALAGGGEGDGRETGARAAD
ncbi:MAG: DUF4340 domain-containing protein [Kiritimatiellae bacterium]|nr:DUF4340 domain-containing protein [Kiritimatiellia bacterium]